MQHITTGESWLFELKEVRAIRTDEYGKPYDGICTLKITNGRVEIEGYLSKSGHARKDIDELERFIKSLGFTQYTYYRYQNGESKPFVKEIK